MSLLGILWCLPTLLLLQRFNGMWGWWSFPGDAGLRILGMPLELLVGWVILWAVVPPFTSARPRLFLPALLFVAVDLVAMPLAKGTVRLHGNWLLGESVAAVVVLLPSLCLQRWTWQGTHLRARATLQVCAAAMLFLYLPAELTAAFHGEGWSRLAVWGGWQRRLLIQILLLLAVPGLAAVHEFVTRGGGTPIPYDPPRRLVVSGLYRYIANPMQASCMLVLLLWAILMRSPWLMLGPLLCVMYSAGVAEWDERADLQHRFGDDWSMYRKQVGAWWPRWRPHTGQTEALLYIARGCGQCSEVRRWLEARSPAGLCILDAETLPAGSIGRMRYVSAAREEAVEGVRAMGRAMEHLHLGWAYCGVTIRLPIVWHTAQIILDACGFGPRMPRCAGVAAMDVTRVVVPSQNPVV